jgi:hypothetical protein
VLLVGLAILKPWSTVEPGARPAGERPGSGSRATAGPPAPTARPDLDLALVASFCLEPTGWRLFATEHFAEYQVRSWKTMVPAPAAVGPGDERIPLIPEASRAVLTLGYCAPTRGSERPPEPTTTTIFHRVVDADAAGGVRWEPLTAPRVLPVDGVSRLGGVWGPPGNTNRFIDPPPGATGWPSGTYVFRIASRGRAGGPAFERWFGVVVEILPPPS